MAILRHMSEEDYRAHPGINFSTLKYMDESPKKYQWVLKHGIEDTAAMSFGRVCHYAHLFEEEFDTLKLIYDEYKRGSKKFQQRGAEVSSCGKTVGIDHPLLSSEELEIIEAQRESFRQNECYNIINPTHSYNEKVVIWEDGDTGLTCKCRIDSFNDAVLTDIKTTTTTDEHTWINQFYSRCYHAQLAMYYDALSATGTNNREAICLKFETKPCYDAIVYHVDQEILNAGRERYKGWLKKLKDCLNVNSWPGKTNGLRIMPHKAWALNNVDDETLNA